MVDSLKDVLFSPGCFGDLEPSLDTHFSEAVKDRVRNGGGVGKHFSNAFGYIMRSMDKELVNG